jgi:hypothetical protein
MALNNAEVGSLLAAIPGGEGLVMIRLGLVCARGSFAIFGFTGLGLV